MKKTKKSLRKKIKRAAFESPSGMLLFYKVRILREKLSLILDSDYNYIRKDYKRRFGRDINLNKPETYTEKLQWMKLFYRHKDMPICSDKYLVREYINSKGLSHLLNELYGVCEEVDNINFDELPNKFVAKATHGSSWNLICTDKSSLDWNKWKGIMRSWLKLNLFVFGREWNYKELKPKIIIEKFIEQDPLIDYKFMCFNGEPKYIQVNNDYEGVHYLDIYTINWEKVNFTYKNYPLSNHLLKKPIQLKEMIELAIFLSKDFPFVRVDFYNVDGEIIFGEMTFFPGGGLTPLVPFENNYDFILGNLIKLPDPNYNFHLLNKLHGSKN